MVRIFILLHFLNFVVPAKSQYTYSGNLFYNKSIHEDSLAFYENYFKIKQNNLYFVQCLSGEDSLDIYLTKKSLLNSSSTNAKFRCENFNVIDMCVFKGDIYLIGNHRMLRIDTALTAVKFKKNMNANFAIACADESKMYLYNCYNYGPPDSLNSLFFYKNLSDSLYKVYNEQKIESVFGWKITRWAFVYKGNFYYTNPLTGQIYEYNEKNKLTSFSACAVNESKSDKAMAYAKLVLDSTNYLINTGQAITEYMRNSYSTLLDSFSFIQKVCAVDDSIVAFIIDQPTYKNNFRDVILYNVNDMRETRRILKWACNKSSLVNGEYAVDLLNNNQSEPVFYNGKVYFGNYTKTKENEYSYTIQEFLY